MSDNVLSHNEMCRREGVSLQRGMNFGLGGNHSVILMSVRPNAPYQDRLEDGGTTLIYEGHDQPKNASCPNPKLVDQPDALPSGMLTQNGKFNQAAQEFKKGKRPPERVRVYEKIRTGIWSYNGIFHLIDAWPERDKHRVVYKFKLVAVEGDEDLAQPVHLDAERHQKRGRESFLTEPFRGAWRAGSFLASLPSPFIAPHAAIDPAHVKK